MKATTQELLQMLNRIQQEINSIKDCTNNEKDVIWYTDIIENKLDNLKVLIVNNSENK